MSGSAIRSRRGRDRAAPTIPDGSLSDEHPGRDIPRGRGCQGDMDGLPVKLWHFDHPHLYVLEVSLCAERRDRSTRPSTTFGIRKIEVRGTEFLLNGEPVRLAGVERMAGSHPDFGMAEPASWIEHDHADLKELNCVLTRVHWQQDRRVLDYCDRHGILIQLEVPDLGRRHLPGPRTGRARGDDGERSGSAPGNDRPRAQPPLCLLLGPVQRGRRPESRRPGVRPAHAPRGQEPRSRPALLLRLQLPPEDARARRGRGDGLHRMERILRVLVRRRRRDPEGEPRSHPRGLPRQAHRHLGVRLLRLHRRPAGERPAPHRDPPDPQRRLPRLSLGRRAHLLRLQRLPDPHRRQGPGRPQAEGPRGRRRLRRQEALLRGLAARNRARSRRSRRAGRATAWRPSSGPARTCRPTRSGITRCAGPPTGPGPSRSSGARSLSPCWRRARRRPSASRRRRRTSGPSSSRSCGRRASPPRRSAPERAGPLRPWAARLSARRGPAALPPCTGCRGRSGPRGPAPGPSSS